jgi:hypothetical protein
MPKHTTNEPPPAACAASSAASSLLLLALPSQKPVGLHGEIVLNSTSPVSSVSSAWTHQDAFLLHSRAGSRAGIGPSENATRAGSENSTRAGSENSTRIQTGPAAGPGILQTGSGECVTTIYFFPDDTPDLPRRTHLNISGGCMSALCERLMGCKKKVKSNLFILLFTAYLLTQSFLFSQGWTCARQQ